MNALAERLTSASRDQSFPNLRPRDASSLILVDTRAGVPHVLMGKRSNRHVFFPNAYVFPGGGVDREDGMVPVADEIPPDEVERLMRRMKGRASERRARALAMAAIRETYEETGLLVGVDDGPTTGLATADWAGFLAQGVAPSPGLLTFVARAITPPRRPRRYDTRFFAAPADAIARALPDTQRPTDELSELVWVPIEEARQLTAVPVTSVILDELEARLAMPGGLAAQAAVPFYHVVRGRFVRDLL